MKLRVIVDVEVSQTMAETIRRNGFSLRPDGSAMQVCVPNSPVIPKRKTHVEYIHNPSVSLESLISASTAVE